MLVFLLLVGYSMQVRATVDPEQAPSYTTSIGTISPKPELKEEPYCGEGGNDGCLYHGKCIESSKTGLEGLRSSPPSNRTGICSCTTKGITGNQCNLVSSNSQNDKY